VKLALAVVLLVSVPHLTLTQQFSQGLRDAAAWFAVLLCVAALSGFARQVSRESARQQTIALDRLNKLAEANALLFQLHRVTQTLPASLDLDGVLDATVARIGELMSFDQLTVLLYEESDRTWVPARRHGSRGTVAYTAAELPAPLQRARANPRAVLETDVHGRGMTEEARSGAYASLRARGSIIGLIAVESSEADHFGTMEVQLLTGLVEPLGVALDNARWFARIRSIGADEERSRIARNLHDQIGQALAALGFGLDHAKHTAERGGDVVPVIDELRTELRGAVREVREALYDLRTEVTESHDLAATLTLFLDRVRARAGIEVDFDSTVEAQVPLPVQRELWWLAREAVVNTERHAKAAHLQVTWMVRPGRAELAIVDDGVGFERGAGRADSYGIIGMRERASSVGATFDIHSATGQGTTVRVVVGPPTGGMR
jgi:signal transduction histidine kinase